MSAMPISSRSLASASHVTGPVWQPRPSARPRSPARTGLSTCHADTAGQQDLGSICRPVTINRPTRGSSTARGLTLIELLIALAVFSVLGVLSWRATEQMINGQQHIASALTDWRQLAGMMDRLELDLLHVVAPPAPRAATSGSESRLRPFLLLRAAASANSELQFLVQGERHGVQRVGYRFHAGQLDWLIWPTAEADEHVARYPLLDRVQGLSWRFLTEERWLDEWPATAQTPRPDAVELTLVLAEGRSIVRLFVLR